MRRALFVLSALLVISILFWMSRPGETQPVDMVPTSLMGLVLINSFPDSFNFLPKTRLGEWLDLDPSELESRLAAERFLALKESIDRACLVFHYVERKESGAFRPHITAFLCPKSGQMTAVEDSIRKTVIEWFGDKNTRFLVEGSSRVIRGPVRGQICYLAVERGWLIVSNSESGWKAVQLTLSGRAPNLGDRKSFNEIRTHLGSGLDLIFYFSGEGPAALLLPEFGYGVRIDGDEVTDRYWALQG